MDHRDHEAFVAFDRVSGEGVGVARFVRLDDPEAAEVAVAVADDWQGRGVGTVLLSRLADRARALGVRRFRASLMADNRRMRELLETWGSCGWWTQPVPASTTRSSFPRRASAMPCAREGARSRLRKPVGP